MKRIGLVILLPLLMSGCVQTTTYSGTDTRVAEREYVPSAAARERVSLGLAYLNRGDNEQAKYNLERALEQSPDLDEALLAMAHYYDVVKDEARAEQFYKRAVSVHPNSADAANNYGVFLCRQQRYKDADKWMNRAVDIPGYIRMSQTYENLGMCARQAGWDDKARLYYERALNYDPRRAATLLEVAELSFVAQQWDETRRYLERYHQGGNESPASLLLGAELEYSVQNTDAARRYGVLLLAKYPGSEQAKTYRMKYY
ncbi:type IV pilus biogenesis/stability protein PilW [Ferrimonas marina]|uniref:Type IV pilus assembly protein PilF n=1 Tax=Ferrimonas marina TaxID=299255 RepID=A0A1M5S4A7_9GAMM|nr:type IV pilus biogenesis/stability protein PilW [Ferrimonas marina]SHH33285.1 type IV pilus assembly protein PilF [Ferrimonas marina]